jgi:hypothetical protein
MSPEEVWLTKAQDLRGMRLPTSHLAAASIATWKKALSRCAGGSRYPSIWILYGPGTWLANNGSVAEQVRNEQYPIVGDGQGVWSWVHVEDAAHAAVLALDQGNPGTYKLWMAILPNFAYGFRRMPGDLMLRRTERFPRADCRRRFGLPLNALALIVRLADGGGPHTKSNSGPRSLCQTNDGALESEIRFPNES